MGKNHRHQKKLKSEKAKVKLKAKKLPKGTNVTDTSFKVKKIVIREQLKPFNEEELLSTRKLNVKELLTRLQHHNTTARLSAIIDLKKLISTHQNVILSVNLGQILEGISHLVLDKERKVRRESLMLIQVILSPISNNQILPYFDTLCSYLRCAMTHINLAIQEDSLLFMDTLLICVPNLVAKNASKILPNFFNLISKLKNELKPERTLTVNLNSKFTMVKWRTKVLERLHDLLKAIVNCKKQNIAETKEVTKSIFNAFENSTNNEISFVSYVTEPKNHVFNKNNINSIPLYDRTVLQSCDFSFFNKNIHDKTLLSNNDDAIIEEFINLLMPLLFDTWLEVGPSVNRSFEQNDSVLSSDAATLLRSILKIIQLLWELINVSEKKYLTKKFSDLFTKKYSKTFSNYVVNNFPYSQCNSSLNKTPDSSGFLLNNNMNDDSSMLEINLMICNIVSLYNHSFIDKIQEECMVEILNYINEILISWKKNSNLEHLLFCILKLILLERTKVWKNQNNLIKLMLNHLIGCYQRKKFSEEHQMDFLKLLCEVLYVNELNKHDKYQSWIAALPYVLCNSKISSDIIEILLNLCKQKNQLLMKSLLTNLPEIFDNFINQMIKTSEITESMFIKLIHILYWLPNIPDEDLLTLKRIFKNNRNNLSKNVHSHFIEMYTNKQHNDNECIIDA